MQRILILLGPTAIGKTSLAINLAKKFNGFLISADSRQVYKGMDIVTGKDKSFPDQGIDLVHPNESFSVSHWLKHTYQVIDQVSHHGKLPIIVGGTGFYIKSLLYPPKTIGIKPNLKLRKRLEKLSLSGLQQQLRQINPQRWQQMNHSDRCNRRRLIRAIEIAVKPDSSNFTLSPSHLAPRTSHILLIGLKARLSVIDVNIAQRVHQRLKDGAIKETQQLFKKYGQLPITLGYSQLPDIQKWITAERQYARRQLTYFKKIKGINWFTPSQKKRIVDLVKNWYYQTNKK